MKTYTITFDDAEGNEIASYEAKGVSPSDALAYAEAQRWAEMSKHKGRDVWSIEILRTE